MLCILIQYGKSYQRGMAEIFDREAMKIQIQA